DRQGHRSEPHEIPRLVNTVGEITHDFDITFNGRASWAGEFHGIGQVRAWLERFYRVGLTLVVDDILIGGWPWDTRIALHFTDRLLTKDGVPVYENVGFIYMKSAWGKVREYEVVEDTERTAALDTWLEQNAPLNGSRHQPNASKRPLKAMTTACTFATVGCSEESCLCVEC